MKGASNYQSGIEYRQYQEDKCAIQSDTISTYFIYGKPYPYLLPHSSPTLIRNLSSVWIRAKEGYKTWFHLNLFDTIFWRERAAFQRSAFGRSTTGNDVVATIFICIFFSFFPVFFFRFFPVFFPRFFFPIFFFPSVATFSPRRSARIKKLI